MFVAMEAPTPYVLRSFGLQTFAFCKVLRLEAPSTPLHPSTAVFHPVPPAPLRQQYMSCYEASAAEAVAFKSAAAPLRRPASVIGTPSPVLLVVSNTAACCICRAPTEAGTQNFSHSRAGAPFYLEKAPFLEGGKAQGPLHSNPPQERPFFLVFYIFRPRRRRKRAVVAMRSALAAWRLSGRGPEGGRSLRGARRTPPGGPREAPGRPPGRPPGSPRGALGRGESGIRMPLSCFCRHWRACGASRRPRTAENGLKSLKMASKEPSWAPKGAPRRPPEDPRWPAGGPGEASGRARGVIPGV